MSILFFKYHSQNIWWPPKRPCLPLVTGSNFGALDTKPLRNLISKSKVADQHKWQVTRKKMSNYRNNNNTSGTLHRFIDRIDFKIKISWSVSLALYSLAGPPEQDGQWGVGEGVCPTKIFWQYAPFFRKAL